MNEKKVLYEKNTLALFLIFIVLALISGSSRADFTSGAIEFIFKPQNSITQFAIWVENGNGEYIGTAYVTNFIGRRGGGNRTSDPDIDSGTGNRLSALPVWACKRSVIDTTYGLQNYYPPASTQSSYPDDIDAVSKATPGQSIQTVKWSVSDFVPGEYICWIEANKSFDFNQYYNYSFYRGQPSVVWNTGIMISNVNDTAMVLDYAGYGSPDGSDGNVRTPDMTITSAVNLLSDLGGYKFKVIYTPEISGTQGDFSGQCPIGGYKLNQNFPNPFNPSTMIDYSVNRPVLVVVDLFDIKGNKIRNLVKEFQTPGDYTIHFNADNLSSGIYFYTLTAGSYSGTKKMLLLH